MTGKFALLIHPEEEVRRRLRDHLAGAGFKVLAAASDREALERIDSLSFLVPDIVLCPLDGAGGGVLLGELRANPLTEQVPVVVFTADDEQRRRALRTGYTHQVPAPYDDEEVLLTARLAIEQHRDERTLSGALSQLSVPDLLQTAEVTRRSGTVVLKNRSRTGTLWLRNGRVIDAETSEGANGKEAVYELALWEEGSFEADFGPVTVPERIIASTSNLLLKAMRLKDEAQRRGEAPPFASMPDPPPPPPRTLRALHRSLTLLNVAASYASEHLSEELVARRLEHARQLLLGFHEQLAHFVVTEHARVAIAGRSTVGDDLDSVPVDALVAGVGAWLRRFFGEQELALPGRFALGKLRSLTEAVQSDLAELGFYQALGLTDDTDSAGEQPGAA